jgi:hypothetical protein
MAIRSSLLEMRSRESFLIIRKDKESRFGLSSDGEKSPNYPPSREAVPTRDGCVAKNQGGVRWT